MGFRSPAAPPAPQLNLLTNPGFEIWQRGTGAFTADAAYTADRWQITIGGTSTMSVSRDSANADAGSLYCAAVTFTFNATSYLKQKIEDFSQLRGRTMTFSARVKCSTASKVRLALDTTGAGSLSYSAYHSGSGNYETLSVTVALSGTGTGQAAYFVFDGSCTAYLDNATLGTAGLPVAYVPLHPADDLARCQRYYEVLGGANQAIALYSWAASITNFYFTLGLKAEKAVAPTVTKNGTWALEVNTTGPTVLGGGTRSVTAYITTTVGTGGRYGTISDSTDDTITVEANP